MASAESYWEKHLSRKEPSTAENYRNRFDAFLEFTGLTHEQVYEMQREAEQAEDPREADAVVDLVVDFIKHLEGMGKAAGTIKNHVVAITMFMKINKLDGFEVPKADVPVVDYDGQWVITKPQIRDAWDRTGEEFKLRNRAMLMLGKDIGFRIGDLAELTVREYLEAEDLTGEIFPVDVNSERTWVSGDGFKRWTRAIVTKKKRRNAYPHIGPEAVEALDAYIDDRRERSGKRYPVVYGERTEMRLHPIFDVDQKLFLGRGGLPLSKSALGQQFRRLCAAWDKVSAHSFRKFHRTSLESAGMPAAWVKKLQGRAASVYSQPEKTGELTGKYIACYDHLRVFGSEVQGVGDAGKRIAELEELVLDLLEHVGAGGAELEGLDVLARRRSLRARRRALGIE